MPDHLHLLARALQETLTDWVARLKSLTTRAAWSVGWRGAIWQPRFFDRALRDGELAPTLAYIVNNPVVAGLVEEPADWAWLFVDDG